MADRRNHDTGDAGCSRCAQKRGRTRLADQALGRSRGGLTTKIHLVCDANGIPLAVDLLPGNRQENRHLPVVLAAVSVPTQRGRPRCRPRQLVADKAYAGRPVRHYLRRRGIRPVIPPRALPKGRRRHQRGPRPSYDRQAYRRRNMIERFIGWLKEHRRIATRYEKYAEQFLAMVKLACIRRIMKTYFSNTA